ncbi:nad-dependent protein deacetylase sirtuin-2-like protein [Dermatophagoides farinae]|uniref:NAD-dependent protein deacetylase n=1 Tax=Dermatophagoides farinae TaxID=6954 RepID=A0A9D4P877_DERFA|nr:NAD-dependent protein deacetylase sirtuin-2-like isoform X1 [Dermatophagoides farinae]KAH7646466.1 nad-dependent protein deacetylase sirtuin-2-like protein [Dermatophagoides farinae]
MFKIIVEKSPKSQIIMPRFLANFIPSKFFNLFSGSSSDNDNVHENVDGISIENIVNGIKNRKYDHIIFMCGAGISTSAGIPDFRSPKTGLFHQLEKYNLPYPEAVFDVQFFSSNPKPFYHLAKNLLPDKFKATPCHYFMRLIHDKNQMLRLYTQNIDSLERIAGIPADKLVEAHGSFHTGHCINKECRKEYSFESMKKIVLDNDREDNVVYCEDCGSYVKPDIIFYGEVLPERFYRLYQRDFINCDLLIIMGTSLTVQPFASLVELVGPHIPRLMINKTRPSSGHFSRNNRDVFIKSETDSACLELAEKLGWRDELEKLINSDDSDNKT